MDDHTTAKRTYTNYTSDDECEGEYALNRAVDDVDYEQENDELESN